MKTFYQEVLNRSVLQLALWAMLVIFAIGATRAWAAEEELHFTLPTFHINLPKARGYDIDKLAKAVALHETSNCTAKKSVTANKRRNCFGIMYWPGGVRTLRTFKTKEDSYKEFKRIWLEHYKEFPTMELAKRYSGNDRAKEWFDNVTYLYYNM